MQCNQKNKIVKIKTDTETWDFRTIEIDHVNLPN